jgi:hypothetical protein
MDRIADADNGGRLAAALFIGLPAIVMLSIFIKTVAPQMTKLEDNLWGWTLIGIAGIVILIVVAFNLRQRVTEIDMGKITIDDKWLGLKLRQVTINSDQFSEAKVSSYSAGFAKRQWFVLHVVDSFGHDYRINTCSNESTVDSQRKLIMRSLKVQ